MSSSDRSQPTDRDVAPLGGAVSEPPGDTDADGMAGPVYPPPETEPDAHPDDRGADSR